ncbi:MAG: Ig-like domain repeat protein [Proteobacteria bacterium]|nr:Ig-like domain repeat protein [Pseudomonadota bacterium]
MNISSTAHSSCRRSGGDGSTASSRPRRSWLAPQALLRLVGALILTVIAGLAAPTAAHAISAGCAAVNAGAFNAANSNGVLLTQPFATGDKVRIDYTGSTDWIYLMFSSGGLEQEFNAGSSSLTATAPGAATNIRWYTRYGTASVTATCTPAPAATFTNLSSTPNPSRPGESATFTVTVSSGSAGTPTGTVTVTGNGAPLATVTLSGGTGSFSTAALAIGSHTIAATYGGDSSFAGSTTSRSHRVMSPTTTTTLASSRNPSEAGQAVTFTATVASVGGTPTGTVTFLNGGVVLGSAALSGGVATFTTSTLAKGTHTITAAYAGDSNYVASTSASLAQAVQTPAASMQLRNLQTTVTRIVAQTSGQAITGAIDAAINEAFNEDGATISPSEMSFRFNSGAAEGDRNSRGPRGSRDWLVWMDVRNMSQRPVDNNNLRTDVRGSQVNAIAGITRRVTPSFIVGVMGGFEGFDFTSQSVSGRLKGHGMTVGAYLGWQVMQGIRFDAALAHSWLDYEGVAGNAMGTFAGRRLLASVGISGNYKLQNFLFEPSARLYGLWENQNAYVDSLGTAQDKNSFATARASGGMRVSYTYAYKPGVTLIPTVGLFGDYYFSSTHAVVAGSTGEAAIADGWSARISAGLGLALSGGARLSVDTELGGIGSATYRWTMRGKVAVPF